MMDRTEDTLDFGARDEIDLHDLLAGLWRRRWVVVACVTLGLAFSIVHLHRSTYRYTATLRVTPAQGDQSASNSRLSGLASLASTVGLGGQSTNGLSFVLYTKGVGSRSVANQLAQRPEFMRRIFASEWDKKAQRYVEPKRGAIGSTVQKLKKLLGFPPFRWRAPDAGRLQEYIVSSVKVTEDADSPVVTLVYSHPDPRFAAKFLLEIHMLLDDDLRRKARERAADYVAYLSNQLRSAELVDQRAAIVQALSEQEKNLMMASSNLAFAAEPMDPIVTSLRPTSPRPLIVLILGLVFGAIVGVVIALAYNSLTRDGGGYASPRSR